MPFQLEERDSFPQPFSTCSEKFPEIVGAVLVGAQPSLLLLIFPIEEIGLEGCQAELSTGLVDQEADIRLRVVLKFGIDPLECVSQRPFHRLHLSGALTANRRPTTARTGSHLTPVFGRRSTVIGDRADLVPFS